MGLVVEGLRAMDYSGFGVGDATRVVARLADRPRQRAEIQASRRATPPQPHPDQAGPRGDVPR